MCHLEKRPAGSAAPFAVDCALPAFELLGGYEAALSSSQYLADIGALTFIMLEAFIKFLYRVHVVWAETRGKHRSSYRWLSIVQGHLLGSQMYEGTWMLMGLSNYL